jgi:hypothetical protein
MQVIAGTYATYGAKRMGYPAPVAYGVSENPLANIYAAVNYAAHNRGFGTGYGQIGSGHGYGSGGLVPGMATGGTVTAAPDASAYLAQFKADQAQEYGAWANLYALSRKLPAARTALHNLAAAQSLEEAGYDRVLGGGDTPGNLSLLAGRLRKVIAAAQVGTLAHGAHPAWDKGVQQWANSLLGLATQSSPPQFLGSPGKLTGGVNAPWKPGDLGPVMSVPGGVLTFDRGGLLPPGLNLAYNGTGRSETVSPAGSGGVHLHLTVNGPIGSQNELEDWYVRTANRLARTGRLTQAVRTAGG